MNIVVHDYACHPFTLELANYLAKKGHSVNYLFSKQINLTGSYYKKFKHKNLKLAPITTKKKIEKFNFISRRFIEKEYGKISWKKIKSIKPEFIFLVNLPIDPLYFLIKKCKISNFKTIFWIQDIYYLAIKNKINNIPVLGRLISRYYELIEKKCSKLSYKNIFISLNYKKFFPISKTKNYVIENWVPLEAKNYHKGDKRIEKQLKINNKFTFMYTGTIGLKHQYENLILLAKSFPNKNVIVLSVGKFADILKEHSKYLKNLRIYPFVSYQKLPKYLFFADVTLVNLKNDSSDVCVPSKILTYCTLSKPILASMPKLNPASKIILNNKMGLVSNPNDNSSYLNDAKLLISNRKLRNKLSDNAFKYAKTNFNIHSIYQKFDKIIK